MKDYSGPAFPTFFTDSDGGATMMGMTLRDYLAAKAIYPLLAGAVLPTKEDRAKWLPMLAEVAYEMADAMLLAREN